MNRHIGFTSFILTAVAVCAFAFPASTFADDYYDVGGYDGGYEDVGGWDGGYSDVGGYDGGYGDVGGWDGGYGDVGGWDGGYSDVGGWDGGYSDVGGWDGGYSDVGGWDGGYSDVGGYDGYDDGYYDDYNDYWEGEEYQEGSQGERYSSSGGGHSAPRYSSGGSSYSMPRSSSGGYSYSAPIQVSSGRSYVQPTTYVQPAPVVTQAAPIHNVNNNTNNNTNINNVSATAIAIAPAPVAIPVAAYIPPTPMYHVPVQPTPYVSLSQIPYTGFDFGPVGNAMYWLSLISLALGGAYFLLYFRGGALAFAGRVVGGRTEAARSARLAEFTPLPESAFAPAKTVQKASVAPRVGTLDSMSFTRTTTGAPTIVINRS